MTTIENIDQQIRAVTFERIDARPFLCQGSPLGAEIFIAGINPGTPTPFWPFWSIENGCDKQGWLDSFYQHKGGEKTRKAIEILLSSLAPIKYIETNLYHIYSKDEASLAPKDRNTNIFEYLLKTLEPEVIVLHGRSTRLKVEKFIQKELKINVLTKALLFKNEVNIVAIKHFSRVSHQFIKNLGGNIKNECFNKRKSMKKTKTISDQTFLSYLDQFKKSRTFNLPRGACYQFKLKSAPNPTKRIQFNIKFFSDEWKKDHDYPAKLAMECLDIYNSGLKQREDYRNKTGQKSRSRRGNYLLPVLKEIEKCL